MEELKQLTDAEKDFLIKTPVYVSLLAANADGEMDEQEKNAAIKLSHIKTFSCKPILKEYYQEVQKHFDDLITQINQQLPNDKLERENLIKSELSKLEPVLNKLSRSFAYALNQSLTHYTEHVSNAHRNVFTSFIIPVYIKGLNE